jgi:aerobic carbon-monoxide dehydrogenase large subunit
VPKLVLRRRIPVEIFQKLSMKLTGQSVKRIEDPRLLAGKGSYIDDIHVPNLLFAEFVRSTYPHARIKKIDASQLVGKEGYVAFFTAKDFEGKVNQLPIPEEHRAPIPPIWPLAKNKVRWVGEPLALVVAKERYIAEDLVSLVEVEYEPLPAVVDPERSLDGAAPKLYEDWKDNLLKYAEIKGGDVEKAFREADIVIKDRIKTHRHTAAPIENRGVIARFDSLSGKLDVLSQVQFPHVGRTLFAKILGMGEDKVHFRMPDVGGAFGLKGHVFPEDVAVCVAARLIPDTSIKWIEKRTEDISFSVQEREQIHYVEVAAKKDGTILGVKDRMTADMGAYGASPWGGLTFTMITGAFLPGPYRFKNYSFQHTAVLTNKTPMGSVRGPGMFSANFVMERAIDLLAHKLGLDPYDVRMRNLIRSDEFPFTTASRLVYDKCSLIDSLKLGSELVRYKDLRKEHEELRKKGIYRGIGMATLIEIGGIGSAILGPSGSVTLGYEVATTRVEPDGSVKVFTGLAPHGQSSETTLAQAVADEFVLPIDKVSVIYGDTDQVPYGMGTWGSRGAPLGTSAAMLAATKTKQKAMTIAASLLEARPEDIEIFVDGRFSVKGIPSSVRAQKSVSLADIATVALRRPDKLPKGLEPGLEATGFFEPEVPATWSNAMTFCEVELDLDSGKFKILRFFVVEDCGKMINPMVVEGQVHGGIVEGLGGAVFEEISYTDDGQIKGGNFLDYLMPSAAEMPNIEVAHIETFSEQNPSQTKGLGEGGTIVAPAAVANAIEDALVPLGRKITEIPLKPEAVLNAIKKEKNS